ncbi:MAG: hypothetical protein AAFV07_18565 [Bacteroidota bacterium]
MSQSNGIKGLMAGGISGLLALLGSSGLACAGTCGAACGAAVLPLLGLSTGAMGAFLSRWQPAFLGLSLLAFGYAFWGMYRRKRASAACSPEGDCACPPPQQKVPGNLSWVLVIALAIGIGWWARPEPAPSSPSCAETCSSAHTCVKPTGEKPACSGKK